MSNLAPTQRAGELDQRVELQKEVRVSDGQGGFTREWQAQATVWAQVRPLSGNERAHSERLAAEGGYRVVIRNRDDVNEAWRVYWIDREIGMNIRFSGDPGKRDLYRTMECDRGVAV